MSIGYTKMEKENKEIKNKKGICDAECFGGYNKNC
jgi:hypothetical protein